MNAQFLTFEGIDFSGKTTQALKLVERLKAGGHEVVYVREPGGTKISEAIRTILLDVSHAEMHARTELFLYSAARAQIVEQVIRPALQQNRIVVCDRYADSSTAYQGYGRGLDLQMVLTLNQYATRRLVPRLTVLLDLPPELASERRRLAGKEKDRLESEERAFYQRVRNGYLEMAQKEPNRFWVVDGTSSPEVIHQMIWERVTRVLRLEDSR
ncbi:MAG: dTMP kinase [Calditrichaeota bacterium]|nr:MAG: dTMP kinase [Calditrichota bacterium]